MLFSFAGLVVPSTQKGKSFSSAMGNAPLSSETALHRDGGDFVGDLAKFGAKLGGAGAGGRSRKTDLKAEHVVRIKSGINAPQTDEGANGESGGDEENDGERHFDDHEDALRAIARAASAAAAFFQRLMQIRMRGFERGREAKENSGEKRNRQGEKQDARIDAHVIGARQSAGKN